MIVRPLSRIVYCKNSSSGNRNDYLQLGSFSFFLAFFFQNRILQGSKEHKVNWIIGKRMRHTVVKSCARFLRWLVGPSRLTPCSLRLSATSQQYFYLTTNQPPATSQQYSSLRTNQHQPSATSQPNRLLFPFYNFLASLKLRETDDIMPYWQAIACPRCCPFHVTTGYNSDRTLPDCEQSLALHLKIFEQCRARAELKGSWGLHDTWYLNQWQEIDRDCRCRTHKSMLTTI
jgi:hypothetical protein